VTYFVTALGTQRFYCESFWWVLAFPLCLHRLVEREAVFAVESADELVEQPAEEVPAVAWGVQHGFA
jgi:hypothetical protein